MQLSRTLLEIEQMMPWYFPTVAFIFGACIGSFLNVCIYRIPAGKSIIRPGSHCACGAPIAWYDNIPILSWFILRGHARCCGRPFSFRYPAIETLTGLIFLACWLTATTISSALAWMLFSSILICATFIDLDTMEIPDRFSVGGMLAGIILSAFIPSLHPGAGGLFASLVEGILGAFIGTALVYWIMTMAEIILRKPAMGEGDVKLMGAIGAFCGWQGAVFALFGGAVIGTAAIVSWSITQLIFGKGLHAEIPKEALKGMNGAEEPQPADNTPIPAEPKGDADVPEGAVPFGPSLAAGALVYLFFAQHLVTDYFDQINWMFLGGK
jgi:leader peptidase (prepilin peptidase) / N-methyltransferase